MSDQDPPILSSVANALAVIDIIPVQPRIVRVPLDQSIALRLAEDLFSDRDYPPFDKSLMDGYAVRCADVATTPVGLQVVGEIAAGQSPPRALQPGEAMAIMTGAPVPGGADGVVPVEDVETRPPVGGTVRILRAAGPDRFIARRGSDCVAGQVVVRKGTRIGPAQIAVAASIGGSSLLCFAAPRVAILGTGDELVPIDQQPGPSQIRDSNTPMLAALLRRLGCEIASVEHVRDDPNLIRDAIVRGMSHDALFITGGMSMGEYDYVPRLLVELGVDLKIAKLRIKPGKPFIFGVGPSQSENRSSPFIFGLPGNPVSAFVCTIRLASHLLARMAGGMLEERWLSGALTADLPANGPREFYQPAVWTPAAQTHSATPAQATLTPLHWKGSADLFTLAAANVLLVRAENEPPIAKGTMVAVLEF